MSGAFLAWYGWLGGLTQGLVRRLERPVRLAAGLLLLVVGLHDTLLYWAL